MPINAIYLTPITLSLLIGAFSGENREKARVVNGVAHFTYLYNNIMEKVIFHGCGPSRN